MYYHKESIHNDKYLNRTCITTFPPIIVQFSNGFISKGGLIVRPYARYFLLSKTYVPFAHIPILRPSDVPW